VVAPISIPLWVVEVVDSLLVDSPRMLLFEGVSRCILVVVADPISKLLQLPLGLDSASNLQLFLFLSLLAVVYIEKPRTFMEGEVLHDKGNNLHIALVVPLHLLIVLL
jgi:hypothetical protein